MVSAEFMNRFITHFAVYVFLAVLFITYPSLGPYILLFLIAYTYNLVQSIEGFSSGDPALSFADVNYDISQGNPLSWSGRENPYASNNLKQPHDIVIAQGTPFPLPHEENATTPVPHSMVYFANYQARPSCAVNNPPYSTSTGSVCWTAPYDPVFTTPRQNNAITPSS